MPVETGSVNLPPNPVAGALGAKVPAVKALPDNPVGAGLLGGGTAPQPTPSSPPPFMAARGGPVPGVTKPEGQNPKGIDPVNAVLGLIGTSKHDIAYAAQHPIGRLESKGPFTVHKGQVLGGNDFPALGFGDNALSDFSRALEPEAAAKNLRAFTNPKNIEKGGAQNAPFHSLNPEAAGHQAVGKITPEEHLARTSHAVGHDPVLANHLASWYRELGPLFHHYFGEDAPSILRGFAVSQANASPAGGLLNVMRVRDALAKGHVISPDEISTVVKSIEAAVKGEHVSSGMQAKLHDFVDSLEGKTTRTFVGDHPEGMSPSAIDIHAQRDLGRVDPKILATLRERHGLPVAHLQLEVMERELGRLRKGGDVNAVKAQVDKINAFKKANAADIKIGKQSGMVLDNPQASASGSAYNNALREYHAIADHYNAVGAFGRHDWTPAEVQALGWSAIQRFHGTVPEDAKFAIDRNTHLISFETHGDNGIAGNLLHLPEGRQSWAHAQQVADKYMRDAGLPYEPPATYAKVDPERAARIAEQYAQMPHAPNDPTIRASYEAMVRETMAQYKAIVDSGVRFEFYPEGRDPYPGGPQQAIDDLRQNHHMYVFPTDEGFGTLTNETQHPLLADSGVRWNGKPATYNDIFRAVHDFFGHAKEGVGFRASGEDNAWRSHAAMYSPEARAAMTAETRGQNSWVNYGPHGTANRTALQGETVYADQKAGVLPEWVQKEGAGSGGARWSQSLAATKAEEPNVRRIVEEEGGIVRHAHYGPGGWEHNISPSVQLHVIGSPEQADRIAQRLAKEYQQDEVWAMRPGVVNSRTLGRSRFALELESTAFSSKAGVERFWSKLQRSLTTPEEKAHLAGFAPFEYTSEATGRKAYGIRIITGHGYEPLGSEAAKKLVGKYDTRITQAARDAGLEDLHFEHNNVEVRRLNSEGYVQRPGEAPRAPGQPAAGGNPAEGNAAGAARSLFRRLGEESGATRVDPFFREPARSPEEVQQHIEDAANSALAEGYGPRASGGVGQAPRLEPGETTPQTGGEMGAAVRSALKGEGRGGMPGAAEVRAAQEEERSVARGERARAAKLAEVKAGGGLAGHAAAREAMRGELPKIHWNNQLVELNQDTLDEMVRFVQNHPALRTYESNNVIDALEKMSQGGVPTLGEQRLLERAFGRETAGQLYQLAKSGDWKKLAVDILNVPRAVMASTDLSAPLRQGLVAMVTHPVMTGRNLAPMIKYAKSEDIYQAAMDSIHEDVMYPLAHKAKLALTDIGTDATHGAAQLGGREEARMSNLAEHMPGDNPLSHGYNRTAGAVIRGSDRAYVGFLNKTRMDYFKRLVMQAAQQGHDINDEHLLTSIAKVVNTATGRGNVPQVLQDHLATMNALFFSPRLLASRINLLNPVYYARLDPFARREALRAFVSLGAMAFTVLELAKMAGAQVNTNPTNADFAKIKLGNTRIDFLGGFQQPVRLAAQLYENKVTSSTTGKVIPLGTGFAKTSRFDVVQKFLMGKFSPVPSLVVATLKGQDYTGNPVKWSQLSTWERAAGNNMVPFLAQDLYNLYTTSGPNGLYAGPLDLFGVGVQAYKAKTPSARGSSGGGGGFGSGGTGGFGGGGGFGSGTSGGFGG